MKTDDQKDEYAQRVNHEKEDRVALLRRLKDLSGYLDTHAENTYWPESWHRDAQLIKDTIAHLTAPSGCAEAGERVPEWTVDAVEYDKLYLAACALRSACKSRLPPGHYAKLDEECASIDAIRNAPKHETPAEFLPRPSPSPAGGADGERVDWLEENVETHWPFKCAYTFWVNVETQEPFLVRPTVRQAIDAAIHAATQATPAKDSK